MDVSLARHQHRIKPFSRAGFYTSLKKKFLPNKPTAQFSSLLTVKLFRFGKLMANSPLMELQLKMQVLAKQKCQQAHKTQVWVKLLKA